MLEAGPEPERMLDAALGELVSAVRAERGFMILVDPARAPRFVASRSIDPALLAGETLRISFGVVEQVLESGRPALIADTHEEALLRDRQSIQSMDAKSLLCVPIPGPAGVIYLDVSADRARFFSEDLDLCVAFATRARTPFAAAVERWELKNRVAALSEQLRETRREIEHGMGSMVGASPAMRQVFAMIERVAQVDFPVLIQGETGSGKELTAREIHLHSPRRDGPFLAVNCAEFNETLLESELFGHVKGAFTGAAGDKKGLFEITDGGTLFLDEVENMSAGMQAKLLRVLEDQQIRPVGGRGPIRVDVRIVSATNQDLESMIREGEFREDLFHRLNVIHLELPPLRRRLEDLPRLVEHHLGRVCQSIGRKPPRVEEAALRTLAAYPWPGNVRELVNELKRAALLCGDVLSVDAISPRVLRRDVPEAGLPGEVEGLERKRIQDALAAAGGNVSKAARSLNLDRKAFGRRMEKYGIVGPE